MISGLRIGNFKAFSDIQYVPIRPITLIFGPNSSGKSSIIHSLILAHEAIRTGNLDVHRTEIGGESVDLGGFKQYVFNRDSERKIEWEIELNPKKFEKVLAQRFEASHKITVGVTIGLVVKEGIFEGVEAVLQHTEGVGDLQFESLLKALKTLRKDREDNPNANKESDIERYKYQNITIQDILNMQKEPKTLGYEIKVDDTYLLTMSYRRGEILRLDKINTDHPIMKSIIEAQILSSTTTSRIYQEDYSILEDAITELSKDITAEITKLLPMRIDNIIGNVDILRTISKGKRHDDLLSAFNLIFPRIVNDIIKDLAGIIESQILRLRYLGPLRSYPPRHLAFAQYHDPNWLAGGGFAWEEVRKNSELRKKINDWLGNENKLSTTYELEVQHLLTIDEFSKHYSKRIGQIEEDYVNSLEPISDDEDSGMITYFDMDLFGEIYDVPKDLKKIEQYMADIGELVLKDRRTGTVVTHRDVGIGVSQVLPVLVCAYVNRESLIAIEQPEIHLHPSLQAELGDVFIESALGENKNTLLIETHSEHLILRIMRRIRDNLNGSMPDGLPKISPDDVSILYIQPTTKGSIIKVLELDEEGEFLDPWPGGFFEEGFRERFS